MFKRLFGGNKDDPKRQTEERISKTRYGRLLLWIKNTHRKQFTEYQPIFEEKNQLKLITEKLVKERVINEETRRGFIAFVESAQYDELVKVR
jgi:hypothetical protein